MLFVHVSFDSLTLLKFRAGDGGGGGVGGKDGAGSTGGRGSRNRLSGKPRRKKFEKIQPTNERNAPISLTTTHNVVYLI